MSRAENSTVSLEGIGHRIVRIRGHEVLLDADPSSLYGVSAARLNEQVKRNRAISAGLRLSLANQEFSVFDVANCDIDVIEALRRLMSPSALPKRPVGCVTPKG